MDRILVLATLATQAMERIVQVSRTSKTSSVADFTPFVTEYIIDQEEGFFNVIIDLFSV